MTRPRRPLPARDLLLALFSYDPLTGLLTRANGAPADTPHSQGYSQVHVGKHQYLSHRVIWKMQTGEEPPEVDHWDGIRNRNVWGNLRADDGLGNRRNKKLTAQNKSGLKGACRCKQTGLWKATIKAGGKQVWLGRHPTAELAHAAYIVAAAALHGKFANSGNGPL